MISKRKRNKVMKSILNYYESHSFNGKFVYINAIKDLKLKPKDATQTAKVLASMGYFEYIPPCKTSELEYISLKDAGISYFETNSDSKKDFAKKSIYIPILVSLLTNGAIYLLSMLIEWIRSLPCS